MEKTRQMATKEAEVIINEAKEKANAESQNITQEAEEKLAELKSKIDTNFDDAVKHVVSTVLKA
jgi:V/A-type H+-transporting ATPase subunit G/H